MASSKLHLFLQILAHYVTAYSISVEYVVVVILVNAHQVDVWIARGIFAFRPNMIIQQ